MDETVSLEKKKKVFLGTRNITERYRDLKYFFGLENYDTFIVDKEPRTHRTFEAVDICLEDYKSYYYKGIRPKKLQIWLQKNFSIRKKVLSKAIKECDLFIFFWETLYNDFSDLEKIRDAGKTIIICFVGSDIRNEILYKQNLEKYGRTFFQISEVMQCNIARKNLFYSMAKKYSTAIFSRPDQSQIFDQPYYRMLPFVNLSDFTLESKEQNEIPLIMHAPTSSDIKGTDFFENKLNELKSEGVKFQYKRIENLTQLEVRAAFLSADIVLDQLYLLGGGKISAEGMAQGCVVMSAMGYNEFENLYAEKPPIVDFKEDNFLQILKELILNKSKRQNIADQGLGFVRRNLNCKDFVSKLIAIHEGENVLPDFVPKGHKHG